MSILSSLNSLIQKVTGFDAAHQELLDLQVESNQRIEEMAKAVAVVGVSLEEIRNGLFGDPAEREPSPELLAAVAESQTLAESVGDIAMGLKQLQEDKEDGNVSRSSGA